MQWRKSESTVKPELIDTSDAKTYYIRKNIVEHERDGRILYSYEEIAVPKEDWLYFISLMEIKESLENHEEILAEELVNQMDLMSALEAHEEMLAEILINTI